MASSNILVWYFITFYETILVPLSLVYMIGYFLLHSVPSEVIASLSHLLPFEDILFQSHFLYYISIVVFFFSFLFLRSAAPDHLRKGKVAKRNEYYERVLYMIGMIVLIQLMFQQDKMNDEILSMERAHFLHDEKIEQNTFQIHQKEKQLIDLYESKFSQLKNNFDLLQSDLTQAKEKILSLEKRLATLPNSDNNNNKNNDNFSKEFESKFQSLQASLQSSMNQFRTQQDSLVSDRFPALEKALAGFQKDKDSSLNRELPSSSILIWYGKEVPAGYRICDGTREDIPDLRNRYLIGAGGNYKSGDEAPHDSIPFYTAVDFICREREE
jgi:hypothetical protein